MKWLLAGSPPHYVYLLAGYAVVALILSKIPKVRANEPIALLFNAINPILKPFLLKVPVFGVALAAFLDLWDSPQPVAAPVVQLKPVDGGKA